MMGHEILTKFVGTQFSQFGCPATEIKEEQNYKKWSVT